MIDFKIFFIIFPLCYDQLDQEESENWGPEIPGSTLTAPEPKNSKLGQTFKVIILRFSNKFKPNRPRGIRNSRSRGSRQYPWGSNNKKGSESCKINHETSGPRFSDSSWSIWFKPTRKSRNNAFKILKGKSWMTIFNFFWKTLFVTVLKKKGEIGRLWLTDSSPNFFYCSSNFFLSEYNFTSILS